MKCLKCAFVLITSLQIAEFVSMCYECVTAVNMHCMYVCTVLPVVANKLNQYFIAMANLGPITFQK